MNEQRDHLGERFEAIAEPRDDSDWLDVRRRHRRRTRRLRGALLAASAVLLAVLFVAPGIGLGGRIVGLFTGTGKPVPLGRLTSKDQELLVTSLCRRPGLVTRAGHAPQRKCFGGSPEITEIANNGARAYWKIVYPGGRVCVSSGSAQIRRDRVFGDRQIGEMVCTEGANVARLLPSPGHPITTFQIAGRYSPRTGVAGVSRILGLAGEGVATVGIVDVSGNRFTTSVEGRMYALAGFPDRDWVAVVAYDVEGKEVYREDLPRRRASLPVPTPAARATQRPPSPPPLPSGEPIQHAEDTGATADVYKSGVVSVRFTPGSGSYRFLRDHMGGGRTVTLECGRVAYGAGTWATLAAGAYAAFGHELRTTIPSENGVAPPFDACSVRGHYGRRWDEHVGYHNALEVPFNAAARRFFAEQAAARRVAYFVRSPKMHEIRRALKSGGAAPSSTAIAARFDSSVVALSAADETPPSGKVGVWSDGQAAIVASERADDGRRMYVTLKHGRIGPHNLHSLAFVF